MYCTTVYTGIRKRLWLVVATVLSKLSQTNIIPRSCMCCTCVAR